MNNFPFKSFEYKKRIISVICHRKAPHIFFYHFTYGFDSMFFIKFDLSQGCIKLPFPPPPKDRGKFSTCVGRQQCGFTLTTRDKNTLRILTILELFP